MDVSTFLTQSSYVTLDKKEVTPPMGGQPASDFPAAAVLDLFAAGLCVVELNRRIRLMNRAVHEFVGRGDNFMLHNGFLCGVRSEVTRRLDRALELLSGSSSRQDAFQIEGACGVNLQVKVSALTEIANTAGRQTPPLALVMASRPASKKRDESVLRSLFGLSCSEAAILQGLLAGMSLEQCAQSRSVAVSTARSQLKSIFSKTNTTSQAQLVALASTLPATAPTCNGWSFRSN